jgi:hypothetical protein
VLNFLFFKKVLNFLLVCSIAFVFNSLFIATEIPSLSVVTFCNIWLGSLMSSSFCFVALQAIFINPSFSQMLYKWSLNHIS